MTPADEVKKRLVSESAEHKSDISNLEKKLHYLETTAKNSQEHIEQMLGRAGRSE